jgi:acetyl esterase/lipase
VQTQDHAIAVRGRPGDIRIRTYRPIGHAGPLPALLWFHGGGFHRGSLDQDGPLCARIAVDVGLTVASVGYRLAPEHPFPAGVDDCYAGLCWTRDHAGELGIDGDRIAVIIGEHARPGRRWTRLGSKHPGAFSLGNAPD